MRKIKERKPVYTKEKKEVYNPGFVDCYQKPWYIIHNSNVKYYGRFCEEGYPGEVRLEFNPIRNLINKIEIIDSSLKSEIITMIEEMEDAYYAQRDNYINSLPSGD